MWVTSDLSGQGWPSACRIAREGHTHHSAALCVQHSRSSLPSRTAGRAEACSAKDHMLLDLVSLPCHHISVFVFMSSYLHLLARQPCWRNLCNLLSPSALRSCCLPCRRLQGWCSICARP